MPSKLFIYRKGAQVIVYGSLVITDTNENMCGHMNDVTPYRQSSLQGVCRNHGALWLKRGFDKVNMEVVNPGVWIAGVDDVL